MTVFKWSQTAANNDTIDSTINFKEQQSPGSVNDSARAVMAAIAKLRDDMSGKLSTAGTSTAYTITSNQGFTSLIDGAFVVARVHTASGVNPTLALDGLTAKSIRIATGVAVPTTRMPAGAMFQFTYDLGDDCFYADGAFTDVSIPAADIEVPAGSLVAFFNPAAPTGWTKSTTHNNKAIRLSSGTGGATGGSSGFTSVFTSRTPSGTVNDHTLTVDEMPSHTHSFSYQWKNPESGGGNECSYLGGSGETKTTTSRGSNHGHNHGFTGTAMDFAVQYVDAIICSRDA